MGVHKHLVVTVAVVPGTRCSMEAEVVAGHLFLFCHLTTHVVVGPDSIEIAVSWEQRDDDGVDHS